MANSRRPEIDRRYETGHVQVENGRRWHSFSGNERNHLFMNQAGEAFEDKSALSGVDNIADGRSFGIGDFDRDGWQDIALVNANYPLLNVYRNELGNAISNSASRQQGQNFIVVRLRGGNHSSAPTSEFGNRDAIGAVIELVLDDSVVHRELRCGEGFAAQNSSTRIIGIGHHQNAADVVIRWPTGKTYNTGPVHGGQLVTVFENPEDAVGTKLHLLENYRKPNARLLAKENEKSQGRVISISDSARSTDAQFRLITTMATWCAACKKHLPQVAHLRATFNSDKLDIIGVPVDPIESRDEIARYVEQFKPAYRIEMVDTQGLAAIRQTLKSHLRSDALSASIITDSHGKVLQAFAGLPSASQVAKAMETH